MLTADNPIRTFDTTVHFLNNSSIDVIRESFSLTDIVAAVDDDDDDNEEEKEEEREETDFECNDDRSECRFVS